MHPEFKNLNSKITTWQLSLSAKNLNLISHPEIVLYKFNCTLKQTAISRPTNAINTFLESFHLLIWSVVYRPFQFRGMVQRVLIFHASPFTSQVRRLTTKLDVDVRISYQVGYWQMHGRVAVCEKPSS